MLVSRALSLLVAAVYFVLAGIATGWTAQLLLVAVMLAFPLALIWFPEEIGDFTGHTGRAQITSKSPGCMVAAGGWFLLVGWPAIMVLIRLLN